ncbi:hypothetical protein OROHE_016847 [Orobanche hederae]
MAERTIPERSLARGGDRIFPISHESNWGRNKVFLGQWVADSGGLVGIRILRVVDMGLSKLKQKRSFVTRSALKDLFDKERALGGQHETTQKLRGVASTLPSRVNTELQTTEDHLTVESANTLPSLTNEQAFEPGHESSPIQSTETIQHASTEDVATTSVGSEKRSRGLTTGKGLQKYFDSFGKIKINMDQSTGRPVNAGQSAKLSSNIGIITRGVLPIPKTWKDVDESIGLMPVLDHLLNHMDVNIDEPGVKRSLVESIKRNTQQSRYKLHQHFLQYAIVQKIINPTLVLTNIIGKNCAITMHQINPR